MRAQRFSRWFTVWPSTHVNAGKTVEVMPVSEHEAALAAARQVDEAMVDRMMGVKFWSPAIHGVKVGHRINHRELARAALLAALNVPEPEETS